MKTFLLSALAALFLAAPAAAQPIAGADLDALFETEPQIEVNLQGSLLRLAAAATRESEPETAAMIEGLRRVTVRVYPAPTASRALAVTRLAGIADQFEADGWLTLVRVRSLPGDTENDGDVWIFVRDDGDVFDGLAVLAVDDEDQKAVVVLIDGTIDPEQVGALTRRFGDIDYTYGFDTPDAEATDDQ